MNTTGEETVSVVSYFSNSSFGPFRLCRKIMNFVSFSKGTENPISGFMNGPGRLGGHPGPTKGYD